MPIISIIIPIYNVEKYLRRCLDSILAQTFTDFECILIDDGSPDKCPEICDEYANKDKRFVVIHQENAGTAHARDAGIKTAGGKFLVFVDSDDWLEPNALELLYRKQQEMDADIVIGGFMECYQNEKIVYTYPTLYEHTEILSYFLLNRCQSLWGKLYKKKLFSNYIVPATNIGEDAIINIQIFLKIKQENLQILDTPIYNYDRNTNGITTRIKYTYTSYLEDPAIQCRLWIEEYIKAYLKNPDIKMAFNHYMITEAINPYLRFNRKVTRSEIDMFYSRYYKNYSYKNQMKNIDKFVIPLFHFSIFFGKVFIFPLHIVMLLLDRNIKTLKRIFLKQLGF